MWPSKEAEILMKEFYKRLSEKDRRLYTAMEAQKLPHGGKLYISNLFGCARTTIDRGIEELNSKEYLEPGKIRRSGGGPKWKVETVEGLNEKFLEVLKDHTAGSPTKEIYWTNLTREEIREKLKLEGFDVSITVLKQLLKKHRYVKRKALKKKV